MLKAFIYYRKYIILLIIDYPILTHYTFLVTDTFKNHNNIMFKTTIIIMM